MSAPESHEDWIVREAQKRPPAERSVFLDGACAGDLSMRQHIEIRLSAQEPGDTVTVADGPMIKLSLVNAPDEAVGQMLGRYKVLQKIGEGGCGAVYMAEQEQPVRRRVALKVIKLGMDTKTVIARFEAERQALALMDHPNIAKVLDAGATETGRPYFVMELVRGIKFTDYCDENHLGIRQRLELFVQICQAIQHAHQKGIIHRDIKPSNILVTVHDGMPVPKVIDFGIAKATTDQRLTDKTLFTAYEQFIGTPAYMSPEQAVMSGLDVDTRSDIYSLGVLLYELLTGHTPFDAQELLKSGIDAMRKTIREKEPVRPSTKLTALQAAELTTAARDRSADTAKLLHQLRGDLDWIVMKCLEKDRTRRYDTANGLAVDLKRHLANEPVVARPPSAGYRFQKLLRRNKVMAGATLLVLMAILAGTVVSVLQTLRARRELRRALAAESQAQAEKANAQAALHFIQDEVLSQASPGYQADRDLKVRTLLDRVAERLDRATGSQPVVEASIRQTLGSIYTELGDYAKAIENYDGALRLERQHLGEDHADTLRSLYGLAMAYWWSGGMAKAGALSRSGLEQSTRVLGEKHPLTLQFMDARAATQMLNGELSGSETEAVLLKALRLHREVFGPDDPRTLRVVYLFGVGSYLHFLDAKAAPLLADALERSSRTLGEKHPQTAGLMTGLAVAYANLNQLPQAEATTSRCMELRRTILGEEHPLTLASTLMLARVYVLQGRLDKADVLTSRVLELSRNLALETNPFLLWHFGSLGWHYLEQGDVDRASTLCELAMQGARRKPDANPMAIPRVIAQLGAVRLAQHKYVEAEGLLREGLGFAQKHWPNSGYYFYVMNLLGASLAEQGKYLEAESLLLESCQGLQLAQASMPSYLNPSRRVTESLERLVQLYDAWGKPAQAAEWKKKLVAVAQVSH
ncbi:MAG TPA: serine/threonine-protein kinase [Candidatus Limnocylindrales bacterium]|nr:serine/threonine-protein kinase [Candidatus Limnocylindrales bacterium]